MPEPETTILQYLPRIDQRLDRLGRRLERIERRLDLADSERRRCLACRGSAPRGRQPPEIASQNQPRIATDAWQIKNPQQFQQEILRHAICLGSLAFVFTDSE